MSETDVTLPPPWHVPLELAELAFVDLEMSGLDLERDHTIEVAIERHRGRTVLERFESIVKPPDERTSSYVSITREMFATAPTFREIAHEIAVRLDGAIFVAHSPTYDLAFLEKGFREGGVLWTAPKAIDTLALSRRCFYLPSHTLESLATHIGVPLAQAHRAANDAAALVPLFWKCATMLGAKTAADLFDVRVGERRVRAEVAAALRDAMAANVATKLLYRRARKGAEEFDFVVTAIDESASPPTVSGYVVTNRSRKILRLDRVPRAVRT